MCKSIGCECSILLGVVRLIPVVVCQGVITACDSSSVLLDKGVWCCWDGSNGVKWCQMKVVCAMDRYVLD